MKYRIVYTKQAQRDAKKIKGTPLARKVKMLLKVIEDNPFCAHPRFESLLGDLEGAYSRRINIHHRLVYQVLKKQKIVKILRMWTHYDE